MTGNQSSYGERRFKLGVVELGVISAALAVGGWVLSHQYRGMINTQQEQTKSITALTTQIAVLTNQVSILTTNLANVPALQRQVAILQAEQTDHERRIEQLEAYHRK